MLDLQKHEQFEMEVLKLLSDSQLLNPLTFGGGTCLRLCFGLNRYSIDLDFFRREETEKNFFSKFKDVLKDKYEMTDFWEKHFAFLIELRSPKYPKRLKVEMRKEIVKEYKSELNIAFSQFTPLQVRLTTFTLEQMWQNKVNAILERAEIRDAYDLEFIFKKNRDYVRKTGEKDKAKIIKILDSFKPKDFKVKLGSIIEREERELYNQNGFKILRNGLVS